MTRRTSLRSRGAAMVLLAAAAAAWSCNAIFGIEEIDRSPRADAGSSEAGPEGSIDRAEACLVDSDCAALDPCLTPRCDPAARRCLYATCQPTACRVGLCKAGATRSCTETADPYAMVAVSFSLPGVNAGCNGEAQSCFAAVYPFVILGSATGVVAVSVSDYNALEPTRVPITLPFAVSRIVASGDVVYFLGPVTAGKLAIASLRVPTDPRTTAFAPTVAELAYPFASARIFPLPPSDVLVVHDDALLGYPSARLDATFRGGAAIVSVPPPAEAGTAQQPPAPATGMYGAFGIDTDAGAGATLASVSGDRLLLAIEKRGSRPQFALVSGAGSTRAAQGPIQQGPSPNNGTTLVPGVLAAAPDGTVVHTGAYFSPNGPTWSVSTYASWLTAGSASPRIEGFDGVYAENYQEDAGDDGGFPSSPPPAAALPLDSEIIFTISSDVRTTPSGFRVFARRRVPGGGGGGTVSLFGKNGPILTEPASHLAPGAVGVATTGGLGLVFHPVANGARILVLDPRCPPP